MEVVKCPPVVPLTKGNRGLGGNKKVRAIPLPAKRGEGRVRGSRVLLLRQASRRDAILVATNVKRRIQNPVGVKYSNS